MALLFPGLTRDLLHCLHSHCLHSHWLLRLWAAGKGLRADIGETPGQARGLVGMGLRAAFQETPGQARGLSSMSPGT